MEDVITDTAQATPDWFTRILQEKGYLSQGIVTAVREKPATPGLTARAARLEVCYSDDAPKSVPSQFYLKFGKPNLPSEMGKKEVAFYTTVAPAMVDPPGVRCYDAAHIPDTGKYHVLLEDLSKTHDQTEFPLPPSRYHCEQVMDALAEFHAAWWKHPQLGKGIGGFPDQTRFYIHDIEETFVRFADFLGDRLSPERRGIYEQVIASLPDLWNSQGRRRLTEVQALTLTHGDAHFWSFLYPRDSDKNSVCIIDWQSWGIGIGTDDLAYMIALFWYPERRQALEKHLVKRYCDSLLRHGVKNYGWDACWYDYRVSAIINLFIPVWQWKHKIPAIIWWSHIERGLQAFRDLDCGELLSDYK